MSNVVRMPNPAGRVTEIIVMEPRQFEEMPQVIQALRQGKPVLLNLTTMSLEQAQRAVDFVVGGTYCLEGNQERIGQSVFLFTPSSVQVQLNIQAA